MRSIPEAITLMLPAGQKCRVSEEETRSSSSFAQHNVVQRKVDMMTAGYCRQNQNNRDLNKIQAALPSPVDEIFHLTIAKNYPLIDKRPQMQFCNRNASSTAILDNIKQPCMY